MPIASIISGLTALAGSGMAVAKMIRDDKQSRYPPEYLMYKDMMKDARKYGGYPLMGMMTQPFIAPMAQPPQPVMIQPNLVQQILQEYQKQQLTQMITNMVVQRIQQRLNQPQPYVPRRPDYGFGYHQYPQRQYGYGYQPRVPPPLPTLRYVSEPMWDTPADGGNPQPESPSYQLALVPQPIPMPQPQPQPYVNQVPTQPPPSVKFCQPEQFVQKPIVIPGGGNPYQSQLSWESSNAFNVDQQGLQSFISHCNNQPPKVPDNYVGNTLDW